MAETAVTANMPEEVLTSDMPVAEEVPMLESAQLGAMEQVMKQSKRYAKSMAKLGLKPETNVSKVHIRKEGSLSFLMLKPEVYRFPGTNTFVIFGEAQLEDIGALTQEAAARAAVFGNEADGQPSTKIEEVADDKEEEEENCDAGDLPEKEINMVMSQAKVSRSKAIKALKNNNGDMVNAIMELTM